MKKSQVILIGGGILVALVIGLVIYRKIKIKASTTTIGQIDTTTIGQIDTTPKMTQEEADKLASVLNEPIGRYNVEMLNKAVKEAKEKLAAGGYRAVLLPPMAGGRGVLIDKLRYRAELIKKT